QGPPGSGVGVLDDLDMMGHCDERSAPSLVTGLYESEKSPGLEGPASSRAGDEPGGTVVARADRGAVWHSSVIRIRLANPHPETRGPIASDPFVGPGEIPPRPSAVANDGTQPGNGAGGGPSEAKSAAGSPTPTRGPDEGDPHHQLKPRQRTLPGCF